ncbi:hypothetical protein [Moritella yayanosii]|uniref:Uncharacterized protein n=1 Tax=Moritella yayanosii TaxID=69539 RepID=A0A330LP26_9GAMM|nr:hypothetical protein [Moritella yayanosii]SQD78744.1 conserved protein of unknown function [Moritella yayanosii]
MKRLKRYKFSAWPNKDILMVAAGVYALEDDARQGRVFGVKPYLNPLYD